MASEVRFSVIRKQLEEHGWFVSRINGSHHIFVKQGDPRNVSVPVHNQKVMPVYVKKVEQICSEGK